MPIKPLFVEDGVTRIELDEIEKGLYVDVIKSMSYEKYRELFMCEVKSDMPFLQHVVKGWNFKDSDGKDIPCNPEMIEKLSSCYVLAIAMRLSDLYTPEKKTLMAYSQGFLGATQKQMKD